MFDKRLLESSELYDKRYKNFTTVIIFPILLLFLSLLIFSVFAKKQIVVSGMGSLEATTIIAKIQSTSSEEILENNLVEGKTVEKNQLLLRYDGASNNVQLDILQKNLSKSLEQKKALRTLRESLSEGKNLFSSPDSYGYYQAFQNYEAQGATLAAGVNKSNQAVINQNNLIGAQQEAIKKQISSIYLQISDYQRIVTAVSTDGAVANDNPYKAQFDSYKAQIQENSSQKASLKSQFLASVQSNIETLQGQAQSLETQSAGLGTSNAYDNSLSSQLLSLKAQALQSSNQEMTTLDNTISDLSAKVALQKEVNKNGALYSANSGVLHILPDVQGLKNIPMGTTIAEIYPQIQKNQKIIISMFIPSTSISGIKTGQKVRFTGQQDLPKALTLDAKIITIDHAPTVTKEGVNVYQVKAETTVTSANVLNLRYGLQGKTTVIVGEKTFFDYYKSKIIGDSQ
ncbi:MAG: bacteriocin secretion accessory protein [Streptococcaceae bacterium]|jgi:competence factor transport accessory protein ComB|nr:bacteriocin secretion accessory protein [Streptococcaceae bacterium]